jgi:hypothetical protein
LGLEGSNAEWIIYWHPCCQFCRIAVFDYRAHFRRIFTPCWATWQYIEKDAAVFLKILGLGMSGISFLKIKIRGQKAPYLAL